MSETKTVKVKPEYIQETYNKLMRIIGAGNLEKCPDSIKQRLNEAENLENKNEILREAIDYLTRQGIIKR